MIIVPYLSNAANQDITLGIGGGLNYGINEGRNEDRSFGPTFGILGMWRNAFTEGLAPEFSFTYNVNQTSEIGGFSQYETSHIMADLRLRYYFMDMNVYAPYVFGGVGAAFFDVKEIPYNKDPEASIDGGDCCFSNRGRF